MNSTGLWYVEFLSRSQYVTFIQLEKTQKFNPNVCIRRFIIFIFANIFTAIFSDTTMPLVNFNVYLFCLSLIRPKEILYRICRKKKKEKVEKNSLLQITCQTGESTFQFGCFFPFLLQPGTASEGPSERLSECRGLWDSEGNEPVRASLLLFFSFSPFLCSPALHSCRVCLKSKKGLGNSFKLLYFKFLWDLKMHTEILAQPMLVPVVLILLCTFEDTLLQSVR